MLPTWCVKGSGAAEQWEVGTAHTCASRSQQHVWVANRRGSHAAERQPDHWPTPPCPP